MALWQSLRILLLVMFVSSCRGFVRPLGSIRSIFLVKFQQQRGRRAVVRRTSFHTQPASTAEQDPTKNTVDAVSEEDNKPQVPSKFVNFPFEYHERIEMKVERLISRGWGMGRVDISHRISQEESNEDKKKWIVMVPNVIPPETVRVRIFRNFANYSEADLMDIVDASPDRVAPVCKLAGECGGCQLQHWEISAQRQWKTTIVEEALDWFDVALPEGVSVQTTLGTDQIYEYRSKITPHYEAPSKSRRKELVKDNLPLFQSVGFQKSTNRQTMDVDHCHIATPAVNDAFQAVRKKVLKDTTSPQKKGATLLFRQANPDDTYVTVDHKEYLTTTVKGLHFTYQAGNFFQNNLYVLPLMVEQVLEQAMKPIERLSSAPTHLVDCYCGSGLFAISAAKYFQKAVGIEINQQAIEEAAANAKQNGIENCVFQAASAEHIFDNLTTGFPVDETVVVLDPPRKGCSEKFLKQLFVFGPQRIVYMSCDPVTQARDAADIVKTGNYKITFVQPFDLFPQTRHIENLMIFERLS